MNALSLSTGWLPRLERRPYYELSSVLKIMNRFSKEKIVDGFEFGLLPEWDSENLPLTPTEAPSTCEKHSLKEILEVLLKENLKILTVHASRDVGAYLCSEKADDRAKGERLANDTATFAGSLGAAVCVFHFWHPWKEAQDLPYLENVCGSIQEKHQDIDVSIENIPTVDRDMTPFRMMQGFRHMTLDLKWASMFGEFDKFAQSLKRIDNVHIQGRYQKGFLVPTVGALDYGDALKRIRAGGYQGFYTVELEGNAEYEDMLLCFSKIRDFTT